MVTEARDRASPGHSPARPRGSSHLVVAPGHRVEREESQRDVPRRRRGGCSRAPRASLGARARSPPCASRPREPRRPARRPQVRPADPARAGRQARLPRPRGLRPPRRTPRRTALGLGEDHRPRSARQAPGPRDRGRRPNSRDRAPRCPYGPVRGPGSSPLLGRCLPPRAQIPESPAPSKRPAPLFRRELPCPPSPGLEIPPPGPRRPASPLLRTQTSAHTDMRARAQAVAMERPLPSQAEGRRSPPAGLPGSRGPSRLLPFTSSFQEVPGPRGGRPGGGLHPVPPRGHARFGVAPTCPAGCVGLGCAAGEEPGSPLPPTPEPSFRSRFWQPGIAARRPPAPTSSGPPRPSEPGFAEALHSRPLKC